MLDTIFLLAIEGLSGKKLATHIGEFDSSIVTERTVRNWKCGKGQPSTEIIEALAISGRSKLRKRLLKLDWSETEALNYLKVASSLPGLVSGLVHSMSAPNGNIYPQTLKLAIQLDEISKCLRVFRTADQIRPFVDLLLGSPLIEVEHFSVPELGFPSATQVRKEVVEAIAWDDLDRPLGVITLNLIMQLMATLDLEFCAGYLGTFVATPVFESLMPRTDSRVQPNDDGTYPAARDLFHIPVRRLLEMSACLRYFKCQGTWPPQVPSVLDMERWMHTNASTITKWRMGRRFTLANFQSIWAAMHSGLPVSSQPNTPTPLVFAANLLTQLYVKGSREKKSLSMVIPDAEMYKPSLLVVRVQCEVVV